MQKGDSRGDYEKNRMFVMRIYICVLLLSLIVVIPLVLGMASPVNMIDDSERNAVIRIETEPNLEIREGYASQKDETVLVKKGRKTIACIHLSDPVMVAQAEKEERWGYFQFPTIFRDENGNLVVEWQMNDDSYLAYGKGSRGCYMSNDEGKTWVPLERSVFSRGRRRLEYPNGNVLQQRTPAAMDVNSFDHFPKRVNEETINGFDFYPEKDLPEDLRGIYLMLWDNNNRQISYIHASINDPKLLRSAINGKMPVVWWGDMRLLSDNTILAGVYGGYYENNKGKPLRSSVSFYKSNDSGGHWDIVGTIPFQPDQTGDYNSLTFDGEDGFTEPAFEVLKDSSLLCVMRSGSTTPMYRSFSKDMGKTWSKPEPFTPNGVMPLLLTLDNGVLVMASGRPGMQLRFSLEGDGKNWTEPIEMLPFMEDDGKYNEWGTTCGYPSVLKVSPNKFYIVYSDFKTKNNDGYFRKSIIFRTIEINRN